MMALLLLALTACDATCRQACQKMVDCAEVDTTGNVDAECREACLTQELLYDEQWENDVLTEAFSDQRNCVRDNTCEDIAGGVCYDEELWAW